MDKIKKILKDNRYTVIGILIFIVIAIIATVVYNLLFSSNGTPIYGNRLDDLEGIEITEETEDKIVNKLKENEIVSDATSNVKGKILNVIITVKEKTKLSDAKKLTKIITENITDEQKSSYDIQVFFDIEGTRVEGYPTIGYLAKINNEFKYTTSTNSEE